MDSPMRWFKHRLDAFTTFVFVSMVIYVVRFPFGGNIFALIIILLGVYSIPTPVLVYFYRVYYWCLAMVRARETPQG